jgi:predicted dehydrogenase
VLETGISLICEKPLGESAVEAEEIVRCAEERSLFLGVCENFRYQARFGQVAQMVADGAIGEPAVYFLNDLHYTPPHGRYSVTPWRRRGDHRGGYLLDGGSHIVAGLRSMTGETPTRVEALPASFHPDYLGRPWDTALANLSFDSGLVGHLALGYGAPDREARHPKVLGTDGTIALKKDRIEVWRADAENDETIELESISDGIDEEWDDFLRVLDQGAELRFSPWEAVADLFVIDAILESAEAGGASVDVRQLSQA